MFVTVTPLTVDVVRPVDGHVDRHAGPRVDDAADAPAAAQQTLARKQIDDRPVERVRDVLRVGPVLRLEVERVLGRRRFVGSLGRALVAANTDTGTRR